MVQTFSTFVTVFFSLVMLIIIGMIFEKQFIAIEDKIDAWFFRVFHIKLPFGR